MSGEDGAWRGAEDVPDQVRGPLADLLLVLADSKRLLGIRYADWILGAPALEAGISCSAMAQDEWGHGRVLYAMLRDFGHDPDRLEHEREAGEYRNAELLDDPVEGWPELLALNLLLDTALTVQFEALRESRFEPLHYKVSKLLDEERFHFEHARGWTLRLAGREKGREALRRAFEPAWESCLRWFGPADDEPGGVLHRTGVSGSSPEELRGRWIDRVGPVVREAGLELAEGDGAGWRSAVEPSWKDWRARARRPAAAPGPDPDTLARVRGDRNRELMG